MTKAEIQAAVSAAIREVEQQCGREIPTLPGQARPVTDLPGWDSLLGVEATLIIEQKIGKELGAESIFVTEGDKPKARSIEEIVNVIFDRLPNKHAA